MTQTHAIIILSILIGFPLIIGLIFKLFRLRIKEKSPDRANDSRRLSFGDIHISDLHIGERGEIHPSELNPEVYNAHYECGDKD